MAGGNLTCSDYEMLEFSTLMKGNKANSRIKTLDFRTTDFGLFRDAVGSHGTWFWREEGPRELDDIQGSVWSPGWTRGDIVWCVEQLRFWSGGEPWERLTRNPAGKAERRAQDTGAGGTSPFPATLSLPSCHVAVSCHSTVFTSRCSSAPITTSCSSFAYIWVGVLTIQML